MTFHPILINIEYDINWLANIETSSSSNTSHLVMVYYSLLCGIGFCLQIFYLVILIDIYEFISLQFSFLYWFKKSSLAFCFIILFFIVRLISYFQYLLKYVYCLCNNKLSNFSLSFHFSLIFQLYYFNFITIHNLCAWVFHLHSSFASFLCVHLYNLKYWPSVFLLKFSQLSFDWLMFFH